MIKNYHYWNFCDMCQKSNCRQLNHIDWDSDIKLCRECQYILNFETYKLFKMVQKREIKC